MSVKRTRQEIDAAIKKINSELVRLKVMTAAEVIMPAVARDPLAVGAAVLRYAKEG